MQKDTLKIIIVGHVDHGKSTLIGRLLLDTNSLPKDRLSEIKKISKELGKDTELAFLTDQLKEERERNITIDTTQTFFKTRKRDYVIIDAPGHVEFLKNMLTGATLAEAAVLITDVNEGVMEQTRRHAYLINMLGIDKIILVFNKMDIIDYNEAKFTEIKNKLLVFFESLGVRPSFIIPISAKKGINITKRSPEISWYKGPALLEALDSLIIDAKTEKKPLRLPVQDIYEIDGKKIMVGKIDSGTIKRGQKVILSPSSKKAVINSIVLFEKEKTSAQAGENIGLLLKEGAVAERGEIIAEEENSPEVSSLFRGNIFWMSDEPLQVNKPVTLRCATQEVRCVAEKIEKRINSSTLEVLETNAKELKINEAGIVLFKTDEPIAIEKFSFIEEMGRFIIEQQYNLQGAGIITETTV